MLRPSTIEGAGAFAANTIPRGTRLLEYGGERITKAESLRRCAAGNHFIFRLDDEWDLDGNAPSNPARFLNHSCAPNCDAEWLDGVIWIVTRRDVAAGEELTFNYGYDLDDYREHPCRCGAQECAGYIIAEELMPLLKRKLLARAAVAD